MGLTSTRRPDDGVTPLSLAVQRGHNYITMFLLSHRAMVDQPRTDGITPLHLAAFKGHRVIVELQLNARANIELIAGDGSTALGYAIANDRHEIVEILNRAQAGCYGGQSNNIGSKVREPVGGAEEHSRLDQL